MKSVIRKIRKLLRHLKLTFFEPAEKEFRRHNRRVWPRLPAAKGKILAEIHPVASSILSHSYFLNGLAQKHNARILGYHPNRRTWMRAIYNFRYHRLYRSFNTSGFFYVNATPAQVAEAKKTTLEILPKLKTKKNLEDLIVDGIYIGDLVYDSYLMKYRVPTVDLSDSNLKAAIEDAITYLLFWRNYIDLHSVKGILVSHCVYYENAIPLRICIDRGIPAYQVNVVGCYLMDKRHLFAYDENRYYPEAFRQLPKEMQIAGKKLAKERLDLRFQGAVSVDMNYSTKSAYGQIKSQRILRESPNVKVLIATHCFFDSPHSYGNNLFPDFYDWMEFLGNISEKTNYDWYIKTHPDVLPENDPIIQKFLDRFPKLALLPRDSSHIQLIQEGINVVLTTYGTIGGEYPALGIPVVNASLVNPHVAYDFNLHPATLEEYEKVLMNLREIPLKIDREKVYEHYFMRHIHTAENWLYPNYKQFIADIGGYDFQSTPTAYEYFLARLTPNLHERILLTVDRFIDSGEFYLRKELLTPRSSSDTNGINSKNSSTLRPIELL